VSRFGFIGPSYRSQSVLADCQTCMNWYLEAVESGMGRSGMVLYPTPGLTLLYSLGKAGVRGEITAQGRTFVIAGTVLWELLPYSSQATIPVVSVAETTIPSGTQYVFNVAGSFLPRIGQVISYQPPVGSPKSDRKST